MRKSVQKTKLFISQKCASSGELLEKRTGFMLDTIFFEQHYFNWFQCDRQSTKLCRNDLSRYINVINSLENDASLIDRAFNLSYSQQPINKQLIHNQQISMQQRRISAKNVKQSNFCHELLQQVGLEGKYQTFIILFCCILCFLNGFVALGTSYYFAIPPYTNCPDPYQGISQCTKYVCSLPRDQRAQFQQAQIKKLKTLGNEFGDLHCQNQSIGEWAKSIPFMGMVLGAPIIGIISDNIGRRFSLIICLGSGVVGYLMVILSQSLALATIGLFITTFGLDSCFSLTLFLVSQLLENQRRQKTMVLIQGFYCIGGLFVVFVFYIFKEWRLIFLCFCLIPLVFCFIFNYHFIKQTPFFLIKSYSIDQVRECLRFIAKINGKEDGFDYNQKLSQAHILVLKKDYQKEIKSANSEILTFVDLFRFKSLRLTTIFLLVIFFSTNFLYFAPTMLINEFGFDFYINGVIINVSELITYLISYKLIEKIYRKFLSIILLIITLLCSFGLIFLHKKQICTTDCVNNQVIFELILVFVMRFCVSLQFQVLFIYQIQLYPVQTASLGVGANHFIGSVSTFLISPIIGYFNKVNFSIMAFFALISFVTILAFIPLKETFGQQPREKIEEIEIETRKDLFNNKLDFCLKTV